MELDLTTTSKGILSFCQLHMLASSLDLLIILTSQHHPVLCAVLLTLVQFVMIDLVLTKFRFKRQKLIFCLVLAEFFLQTAIIISLGLLYFEAE